MIRIALAEDNKFLAQSLINKLGLFDEFKVKYHAVDGRELISKMELDSNVDLVLMDIQMPVMDGIEATKIISKSHPQVKVIMLTVVDTDQTVYDAIQAGAVGYLVKESSPQQIHDGIMEAVKGGAAMSPSIALKAMKIIQNPDALQHESKDFQLSPREMDVLRQLNQGLNYKEMATNLHISPNTVRRHLENIYSKLEVSNKVEAIQTAYRHKLI